MKIYLDLVGCRLNQSEIETFAQQFTAAGHTLTAHPEEADLAIVNTCTVTTSAAADSRKKIRHIARAGAKEIIATGCWATLEPENAAQLLGVSVVVPNSGKETLVPDYLRLEPAFFEREPLQREMIPGDRLRTRAMIKVQDGCDNRCTFCITTIARGESRSHPAAKVLRDIRAATRGGAQEIALTGVHLGSWGQDLDGEESLPDLLEAILEHTQVRRIRLSSLEPWDVEERLIEMLNAPRIARHLHLPLQSGSASVLQRMARKITPQAYADLVEAVRDTAPGAAITTDLIAGFPGETEEEFAESAAFVKEMAFSGGHVFTYSARPGTAAAAMPDQVHHPLRKERNARLRKILAQSQSSFQERFLGETLPVLWESSTQEKAGLWNMHGMTDNYLRVRASASQNLWNQFTPVQFTESNQRGLEGIIPNQKTS
jgi:threonylcarbamoyladenosine tRNA methylthiotransferase MtaB